MGSGITSRKNIFLRIRDYVLNQSGILRAFFSIELCYNK